MKVLRTRLASLLVVVSAGSLALLQSASGLAGVSEANTNPATKGLYRPDLGGGHRKNHQHHGHLSHADPLHKHHEKEGKDKKDGTHHKAKDKHRHRKHKKPNLPTYKISLVCNKVVVDSIWCPVRPTGLSFLPSSHAMNNGAATVYINMQEPCSKDLPPLCSAALAIAMTDDSKIVNLSDDSVVVAKAEGNHDLRKRNRHSRQHIHRGHQGHGPHRHTTQKRRHGHHKQRHNQQCHSHDKDKHPYKDLCVAVGDFCGNKLYGCDFVTTTQYRCDAIGERPRPIVEDSASCGGTNACLCPACPISLLCGSELPEDCKADKNTIYHCPNGEGSKPLLIGHCKPGLECVREKESDDAICGANNCECNGDEDVCSSSFPKKCKLDPHTIYKCSTRGKPIKVTSCKEGEACIAVSDGPICRPDDCKCISDGVFCGDAFPAKCNLRMDALYDCKKGEDPIFKVECDKPGRCFASKASISATSVFKATADDKCDDGCTCGDKGTVCTSTFPPECNLPINSIMECSGSGAEPTDLQRCEDSHCIVANGNDRCSNDKCTCPGESPVCGSDLPKECNAKSNTVYHCPNGKGTKPEELTECKPGTVCNKKEGPIGAACGGKNCECPGDKEVCSTAFPDFCGLDKNAIYKCTSSGKPEKIQDCNNDEACVILSDGAVCTKNDCKCPTDGNVCGSVFPQACKIPTGDIYSCIKGKDPVLTEDCGTGGCIATKGLSMAAAVAVFQGAAAADKCVANPCKCQERGDVCGSTFPEECKFPKDTLYECSGNGAPPTEKINCAKDMCIPTAGDDTCERDPCVCKDGDLTCGSAFPRECKLDPNTVYKCAGATSIPEVEKVCETQCVEKEGPDGCGPNEYECKCKDNSDICGSQFPSRCNYSPDSLYKCSGNGSEASRPEPCSHGPCLVLDGDDKCTPDPCLCKEAKKAVCGKSFGDRCDVDESTLYECSSAGATPKPIEECKAGCEEGVGDSGDVCKDPCVCHTSSKEKLCGSELPEDCKADKNTIYHCPNGEGSKPLLIGHCKPGLECVREKESDDAICGANNCECNGDEDVCSSSFPKKCKLDPHTIYKCSTRGKPIKVTSCKEGEACITVSDGPICRPDDCKCISDGVVCGDAFPAKCNLRMDALYDCKKGEDPIFKVECDKPGRCFASKASISAASVFKATADDKCDDGCTCGDKGTVCTSTFPPECNLPINSIMECSGSGAEPTDLQRCEDSHCIVANGNDRCSNDKCTCPGESPVCGSDLPKECNAKSNTVYHCPGGRDTEPEELTQCKPGTICIEKDDPSDAICGVDNCECFGDHEVCSTVFPDSCGFDENSIYKCTSSGKPEKTQDCRDDESCVTLSDGLACAKNDCKCPADGDVCGAVFPHHCRIPSGNIYSCVKGKDPVLTEDCRSGACIATKGLSMAAAAAIFQGATATDMCLEDPCRCQEEKLVCGSTFLEECKLSKDTLYECTNIGGIPQEIEKCDVNKCIISAGDNRCDGGLCACKDDDLTCGSAFPTECNLDPKTLYNCAKAGVKPTFGKICKTECIEKEGPDKCSPEGNPDAKECQCQDNYDICGSVFPSYCKYDFDTLYRCLGKGAKPSDPTPCTRGPCIVHQGNDECSDPCVCQEAKESVCGVNFDMSCGLDDGTLYECYSPGAKPKPIEKCKAGCEEGKGDSGDVCKDPCVCPTSREMRVCGSELPEECKADKNAVYLCPGGERSKPSMIGHCMPGVECVRERASDDASCGTHNCDCVGNDEVCSDFFPTKCGLEPNTVYKCTANGEHEKVASCNEGEVCITVSDGSICRIDDCKCLSDGPTCGEAFPPDCNIPTEALYDCEKGKEPVFKSTCEQPGRCSASKSSVSAAAVFKATSDDKCVDGCTCEAKETVCAWTFPSQCNLPTNSLVECSGPGTTPINPQICENDACIVNIGDDRCSNDKCTCMRSGLVCGSELPAECNPKNNTVYSCAGQGSRPEALAECKPGTECIPRDGTPSAVCGSKKCDCYGNNTVCSESFPESCGLDKNSIYQCTLSGRAEKVQDCEKGQCVQLANSAVCYIDKCKCPADGDVCGAVFPLDCKIPTDNIYTCVSGEDPVLKERCPAGCNVAVGDSTDKCTEDPCKCHSKGLICGAGYPEKCGYDKDTLYECTGLEETPTEKEKCAKEKCLESLGDDRCDKCLCPTGSAGKICGSYLPEECRADINAVYDCSAGADTTPIEIGLCPPGVECVDGPGSDDAICGSFNCDCFGDLVVCSNFFPEKCGLQPNTVYKCTDSGRPAKVTSCKEGEACITVADGSICRPDDCKCISDGVVCGDAFPAMCNLKTSSLYDCTKGQDPIFKSDCKEPGRCTSTQVSISADAVFKATADDRCIDGCTCGDKGKACTSTFPPECKLPPASIVDCSGSGTQPTNPQRCETGACVVSNGEDRCSNDKCTCPGTIPVCGSDLPKECNAKSNTVYHCPNGKGTEPEELTECKPGTVCNKKETPIGAACGGKICECPGDKEVCSTAFPDFCGLDKNAIYKCTSSGKPEKIQDCNNDEACVTLSDGAVCTKNDCKCPTDGDVCGSVFPQACKIPTGDIYSCIKGKDPVLTEDCDTGGCIATKGLSMGAAAAVFQGAATMDKCVEDPCMCQERGDVCGSTFPEECKFPKDTLYECSGKDATPQEKMACSKERCVPTAGDDVCGSCLCPDGTPTCGSVFGPECKKDNSTLYTCFEVDALPSFPTKCTWGCDVKDGPDKCNTDCLCKNGNDVCGSVFPAKCGYKKESLYKCSGALADPSSPVVCTKGCDVKAGPDTCNTDCLCKNGDDVCGSEFPTKCNLKPDSLYKCSGALADPSFPVVCTKGCDVHDGPDMCNTDCLCKNGDDVCGSEFPDECNLKPDSLYKCSGALADPSSPVVCTKGCDVKTGPDMCITDCLCKNGDDVCGSEFPTKCNLKPNSLYKCSGALADPSSPVVCTKGCDVKDGPDKCNTDCLCKNGDDICGSEFPAKCKLKPDSLYQCSGALADPSSPVVCTKGCVVKDGPDMCNTDCLCKNGDDVCGSEFPAKCKLKPDSLYQCSGALADPSSPVVCTKGCDVKTGPDMCITDCLCKNGDDVCGSEFPTKCNLKPDTLYKCSGALADPSSPVVCTKGCVVKTGPDMCNTDCLCKNGDDVCGSEFPTKCNLKPNSLYKCSGALADPSSPVVCTKGCDVKTGPDMCNTDCLCKNGDDVCGSEFPTKCKLKPDSLYKCSDALADPSSPVVCTKGCDVKTGPDMCNTDCLCKNGDEVCGSEFPTKCNLKPDSLYKCSGALADPSSPVVCTKGCDVKTGPDMCNTDCLCKNGDDICGSEFPAKCKLKTDSLYKCSGALADPSSPVVCTKGCVVKTGPDMCNTDCLCKNGDDVCGSEFPTKCNLKPNSLYKCSGALADPSSPVVCTKGCDVKTGPDMCNTDCLCKNGDDVCGSEFPTKCNLKPDSLYKCSGALADPSSPVVCTKGCVVKTGPDMCNTDCLCKNGDDVCGSEFPTKCNLKPNSLYKCSGALADPSSPVVCTQGCDVKTGSDKCNDDCLCKDSNDVCGSDFPDKCGFKKDSLYKCSGVLAKPSGPQTCTYGPCLVIKDKNDICTPDPCLCTEKKKFCSNASTTSCGSSNNTILECTGNGVLPQVVEECKIADTCVDDPVKGPTCKCLPAEWGEIINPESSKCVAVETLAVGAPVVLMNCTNQKAFKNWHLANGRITTFDNQFCFGYTLKPWPADNPMVVQRCDSNEKTTLGWSIVNRQSIRSGEGNLCVDIQGPIYDDGNPIIAYPCHGGENQLWTLPSGWGC